MSRAKKQQNRLSFVDLATKFLIPYTIVSHQRTGSNNQGPASVLVGDCSYHFIQRGRQSDDVERFFSGWIVCSTVPCLPVIKEFPDQLLLVFIWRSDEIVSNSVCFCRPGNVMYIKIRDRRTYCFTFFIDHRMVDQGNIYCPRMWPPNVYQSCFP